MIPDKIRLARSLAEAYVSGEDRGQAQMNKVITTVVGLTVGALVASFLFPIAISEVVGVSTTNWSSGASSLWGIMDTIIVLALFLIFVSMAISKGYGGR
ncbi:hypothetical protein [Haloferax sp. Q22]|uniref:hypothetical protein n=1 Tax=Haloferax sp. (strain Q22) TaxID=1526048 RepID=UPI000737B519|nr:hypothetical protein [Haloferax sp. Q22]